MVERTTWDGLPVAHEPPFACCVVVWRERGGAREFLVLHRVAPGGPGFEGDWAWTPPSGARQPGETPDEAAERELLEKTRLRLPLTRVPSVSADVAHYLAQAPPEADVALDQEHDELSWVPLDAALAKCLPSEVAAGVAAAAAAISAS